MEFVVDISEADLVTPAPTQAAAAPLQPDWWISSSPGDGSVWIRGANDLPVDVK